ncbi:hypothetical protein Tco_0854532 [Tanacetum coccineum]
MRADAVMKGSDTVTRWVVTTSCRTGDAVSRLYEHKSLRVLVLIGLSTKQKLGFMKCTIPRPPVVPIPPTTDTVNAVNMELWETCKFGEHLSGNDGIGGSNFGVGEGKIVSMGGIGGDAFTIHSIVLKDGRGDGGLVVDGGRSSRVSRKAWGEVGEVENNSSMGSRLMARDDVSLDGWVGVGGGVDLGVVNKSLL